MDNYSITSIIGEGSFGRVYKATRKSDDGLVAIKIISKRGRSTNELKNLRRECDIQGKLKHPNVIEMFEAFDTKNELVVVTECALIDLHNFLSRNGSLIEEKAQILAVHLLSALYYLHSNRILHRDLKPQNVLLNENLHVKLCDFGLARNMTMGTHVLTSIKGTPLYMAPELLAEKPYDHVADLWSLGCIVYEAMAGQPPFCTNSILHLMRLMKNEEIKWPSFLSSNCQSFLQGLLEKDPSLRMTWAQILCNPFVEGKLLIIEGDSKDSPFINPTADRLPSYYVTDSTENTDTELATNMASMNLISNYNENMSSSIDSTNAVVQSDMEYLETDVEDITHRIKVPFSETFSKDELTTKALSLLVTSTKPSTDSRVCFVSGNPNLIVKHFNENFKIEADVAKSVKKDQANRNKDLEKRKPSQNLDNFSVRLGHNIDGELTKRVAESVKEKKRTESELEERLRVENSPPCLPPGWDSCDESQSPPIENEEWLAFLKRSIQEVLDGELDSLMQKNLVSVIVAPLRNSKTCCKVIECVVQLLSLPLVLRGPDSVIEPIKLVYAEVKLVPNLMFAIKLLITSKLLTNLTSGTLYPEHQVLRGLSELESDDIRTICRLFELVCHLIHIKESFLLQFCNAVAILSADNFIITFLNHDSDNGYAIRIVNCILGLLCCVIRELPENAELVENIIFNPQLNLVALIKNENILQRSRMCMLFRLLGRFSLRGLQGIWNTNIRKAIEELKDDSSEQVRLEAEGMINELREFSFYY